MLGEKGFNELDMALFKHLIHNKKPCCFVRTQCDSQINGILDRFEMENPDMDHEMAFEQLQVEFRAYMENEVVSQTDFNGRLGSLFTQKNLIAIGISSIVTRILKNCLLKFERWFYQTP